MSRQSFIAVWVLSLCILLLTALVLWHHEWLEAMERQVAALRLTVKMQAAARADKRLTVDELPSEEPTSAATEAEPEAAAAEAPAPSAACVRASPRLVDEFAGMSNAEIDSACKRRGLMTDTLHDDHWRCLPARRTGGAR